jgi:hypothetical protein
VRRLDFVRIDSRTNSFFFASENLSELRGGAVTGLDFFNGKTRQHRLFVEDVARGFDERIAFLDQQPIFLTLLDFDERPPAVELVAFELEEEFPFLESLAPILERNPFTAIPDDDAAGAVVASRDHTLEVAVLQRMVLDFHGEALVVHVV